MTLKEIIINESSSGRVIECEAKNAIRIERGRRMEFISLAIDKLSDKKGV
jgi:hypothetical protein